MRPTKIKIGFATYRIEYRDVETLESGDWGLANHKLQCLLIATKRAGWPEILLHEILHAIDHVFNIPTDKANHMEEIVTGFSAGLATTMKDNPELFRWLMIQINQL